jgi:hypothetical protein
VVVVVVGKVAFRVSKKVTNVDVVELPHLAFGSRESRERSFLY